MCSFYFEQNWSQFVATHPELKEVNVCEDMDLPYPEFCIALSTLSSLTKLALPTYALLGKLLCLLSSVFCKYVLFVNCASAYM